MKLRIEALRALDEDTIERRLKAATKEAIADYMVDWALWARADQLPPAGEWTIWLLMAGRGFGKTRVGAEWVREIAMNKPKSRIALVGATPAEARAVMVEGEAGLLALGRVRDRPVFESSLRRLTWANGSVATLFGASDPESLRGPSHDAAWCDEIGKWSDGVAAWHNLLLTMRRGRHPQIVATTTPRNTPLIRRLVADNAVRKTHGKTADNALNLSRSWRQGMEASFGQTRLGRQELYGELLTDVEGALFSRSLIEASRVARDVIGEPARVVVGVDPPAGGGDGGGDACGIIVAAALRDGRLAVLADESVASGHPGVWATAVARAAAKWRADRVVVERNQGGAMTAATLLTADPALPVVSRWAVANKTARAEPIMLRYERGEVVHAGVFPALEDELCGLVIGGGYVGPGRSPDRADACIWALTELGEGQRGGDGVRVRVV